MTLKQISKILENSGIESHKLEATLLVSHFMNTDAAHIYSDPDADYVSEELDAAVRKRAERYPLQYIFGEWDFCGLNFIVNESCLIPRQDTEIVAETAAGFAKKGDRILDLCTGSGCLLAAVLHLSGNSRGTAVELYPDTAETAKRNLSRLGFDCKVIIGDVRDDLFSDNDRFDLIISNPPYIAPDEMKALEPELTYEPRHALTDGLDGLSLIEAVVANYMPHLAKNGHMVIEHGYLQAGSVEKIVRNLSYDYMPVKDYGGNIRAAVITYHVPPQEKGE